MASAVQIDTEPLQIVADGIRNLALTQYQRRHYITAARPSFRWMTAWR